MTTPGERDDGFQLRVHMTFSEQAHPQFVQALRGLAPRARSRLIRTLVERALAVGPEQGLQPRGSASELFPGAAMRSSSQRPLQSPLASLASAASLADAQEMGA
jgi:hypothetical protein